MILHIIILLILQVLFVTKQLSCDNNRFFWCNQNLEIKVNTMLCLTNRTCWTLIELVFGQPKQLLTSQLKDFGSLPTQTHFTTGAHDNYSKNIWILTSSHQKLELNKGLQYISNWSPICESIVPVQLPRTPWLSSPLSCPVSDSSRLSLGDWSFQVTFVAALV